MANPSVLTPIGFDTPQLQYAVTPQVAQALAPDSSPDTTGLAILSEANKSFQQTNQAQSQSYQAQAEALNNIQKAQVASAQAIGQAESVKFQATAASGAASIQSWTRLAGTIGDVGEKIADRIDKAAKAAEAKRLADLKAELDRNQITSTTELENLQVDWIEGGRLNKEGTAAYRRAVGEVLAKRPLQADTISALTTKYYSPALDHAKKQDQLVYDTAKQAAGYNRDIRVKQLQLDLTTATAGLENSAYLPDGGEQPFMDIINAKIEAIYADKTIDDLTKAQMVSAAFDPVLKSASIRADTKATLGRVQAGSAALANYITANAPRVMNGELAQSSFNDEANQIRIAYGLPQKEQTDPDVNLARTVKNLETNQKLDTLNKQAIISDAEKVEYDKVYVNSIALQAYLNPTLLATMDPSDPKLDKNARGGIKLALEANKFYGETTRQYRAERERAQEAILKIQQQDYRSFITLINKAGEDNTQNSLAASLRGLGLGMPPSPPGQVGVTQEQLDFMAANSQAVQQAIADSVGPKSAIGIAYKNDLDKFQSMGLYEDKNQSKVFLKGIEAKTVEYNKRMEDMRLKRITQLTPAYQQQPGQSPNFNGGSLGVQVPLMRRSFRGVANVAMPFPVGAAQQMSDAGGAGSGGFFGDSRDGGARRHAGADFPVPRGTPLLSMVYGTISEIRRHSGGVGYGNAVAVKGDDGKEYFYAHLDKSTVALGQRVGPGEKIGYSGDTGSPGAEHLHLEISVDGKTVDPLQVLSTGTYGQQPRQPRTAGSMQAVAPEAKIQVDPRAIPIGGGKFLIDGVVQSFNPDYSNSTAINYVDIKGLPKWNPSLDLHNIKIAPGLEVIGFTPRPIDSSTKPGDPVGYYTLRNREGGVLTQTAFHKAGVKKMAEKVGFDGKGYTAPPRTKTPPPARPTKVDPSKGGRVLLQRTGQKDANGLDIISVSMFDSNGRTVGSYTVNSGKPSMQGADTSIAETGAPLPLGSYTVEKAVAAYDIPGMRSDFIPITPTFKTNRSLLGIHFDGDRATDPGSMGCIVFKSKQEFDTFKSALTSSSISRLDFEGGKVQVVAPPSTSAPQTQVRANKEGQRLAALLSNPNVTAFLDAIANAEGNPRYDQGFGYRSIPSLAEHPYVGSELTPQGSSSASGRYQFMGHTWGDMKRALGLQDFSPTSQQIAALKQLDMKGILQKVAAGNIDNEVLHHAASVWASIESAPGANRSAYSANNVSAGGTYQGFRSFFEQRRKAQPSQPSQPSAGPRIPSEPPPDPRKVPIGGGKYLLNGKIVSTNYTPLQPLEQSYASASKYDYQPKEGGSDAYGYAQLQREAPLLEAVERVASTSGLPAQWIADVAALKGTAGIDKEELTEIEEQLKDRNHKISTPTDLVALVLGEGEKVKDLGVHVGRRYDSQFSRFQRTTAPIHDRIAADCRLCISLQAHAQFVPHRAEIA